MATIVHRARSAWESRFSKPCEEDLIDGVGGRAPAQLLALARCSLRELRGAGESLAWHGVPWRWSWVYALTGAEARRAGADGTAIAMAYLIPEPKRPQIVVPLPEGMIGQIPMSRLKRSIREGLDQARVVAGTHWPAWEITSRPLLDDVLELITTKHRLLVSDGERVATGA